MQSVRCYLMVSGGYPLDRASTQCFRLDAHSLFILPSRTAQEEVAVFTGRLHHSSSPVIFTVRLQQAPPESSMQWSVLLKNRVWPSFCFTFSAKSITSAHDSLDGVRKVALCNAHSVSRHSVPFILASHPANCRMTCKQASSNHHLCDVGD